MCSSATRRSSCMGWSGSAYHNGIAGHGCDAARYEWRAFACGAVAAAMPHRVGVCARVRACVLMCACAYVDVCREGAVERGSDVMRMQRSLELAPLGLQIANFAFARLCDRSSSQCCAHSPQCWRATGSNGKRRATHTHACCGSRGGQLSRHIGIAPSPRLLHDTEEDRPDRPSPTAAESPCLFGGVHRSSAVVRCGELDLERGDLRAAHRSTSATGTLSAYASRERVLQGTQDGPSRARRNDGA